MRCLADCGRSVWYLFGVIHVAIRTLPKRFTGGRRAISLVSHSAPGGILPRPAQPDQRPIPARTPRSGSHRLDGAVVALGCHRGRPQPTKRPRRFPLVKISMARQVANAASKAACFSTKRSAVWIMRTVKSVTESLGGHSRIPLQSALGRRGEPGKRSSQPGNSPTRDEKHLGNPGFQ